MLIIKLDLLITILLCLPLSSLLICFLISVLFYFDIVNRTDCRAINILPSISAITGHRPQIYIWRFGIALHAVPRFLIAYTYRQFYLDKSTKLFLGIINHSNWLYHLINFNMWVNILEIFSLLALTVVSSVENFYIHSLFFVGFAITSILHMVISLYISRVFYINQDLSEMKSYHQKCFCLAVTILCSLGMAFFFTKHRLYCTPYDYSKFSLLEYIFVLINMGFHYIATFDIGSTYLSTSRQASLMSNGIGKKEI